MQPESIESEQDTTQPAAVSACQDHKTTTHRSTKLSRRSCRVTMLGREYYVIRRRDLSEGEVAVPFRFGRAQIASWARDPLIWPVLLEMCDAVHGAGLPNTSAGGAHGMEERLADAFRYGRLLLVKGGVQQNRPGFTGSHEDGQNTSGNESSTNDSPPDRGPAAAARPPQQPEKTWFHAQLLDEDGHPMAGEDYIVVDSDGSKRTGKLDAQGEVYIPAILSPGKCTITFPNVHLNPLKRV